MNAVLAAVRALLEPDPEDPEEEREVAVDETSAVPLKWRPKTLYVSTVQLAERPIETGPTARRDFAVSVLLTAWEAGEEADSRRSAEVSTWLDTKLEAYLAALRGARHASDWDHIQAAVDRRPANLELRALSLRLTGYVIV